MVADVKRIRISPHGVLRVLVVSVLLLILVGVGSQVFSFVTGHKVVFGLIHLMDLGGEQNIPAFFSSSTLLLAAALLGVITISNQEANGNYRSRWMILTIGFIYLAIDEASSIHELLFRPTRELLGEWATGIFYWAWVVPGILGVILVGTFFIGFLLHLPSRTRSLFLIAGALYVGGAIGVEMIEGRYVGLYGNGTLAYSLIYAVEESMEMFGVVLFVFALLDYMENNIGDLQFEFGKGSDRSE